jgi:hypothetical protein
MWTDFEDVVFVIAYEENEDEQDLNTSKNKKINVE